MMIIIAEYSNRAACRNLQWFESCYQSLHPSSTLKQRASTHCVPVFTSKTAFCRSVSFNFSRQLGDYSIDSVLLTKNTLTLHSGSFPVDRRMEAAGQGSASNDFRIYSTVARLHVKYCSSKLLPDTRGKLWTFVWTCTGYYRHWASPLTGCGWTRTSWIMNICDFPSQLTLKGSLNLMKSLKQDRGPIVHLAGVLQYSVCTQARTWCEPADFRTSIIFVFYILYAP